MDARPLWNHQKKAIEMARQVRDLALFFEMGTGKSRTTIEIIREHCNRERRLKRILILGPVIVVRNWQAEFGMFSKIAQHDIVALTGAGKKRVKTFQDYAIDPKTLTLTRPRIFITNYEALEMDALYQLLLEYKPEILVCDESHRLKNPQSKRAVKAAHLADQAENRYLLTGTPILNSAMDIFQQYRILDGGQTFGRNFFEFRGTYFEDLNAQMPSHIRFPKWMPRTETYEILNQKIYRKALRVLKSECLDLPPLIRQKIEVELGPEQKRAYEEMKNEYITWVKEHESSSEPKAVVAQMALVKALRLQQIASGFAKTEDGTEVQLKDNPRLDALKDLLEELTPNHKVIVWATFRENYRQIARVCEELKIGYSEIHGEVSGSEKHKSEARFREHPDCRVIIANPKAAGIGINLVEYAHTVSKGASSYSIFFSRNFSLADDLQAESRNYRGGSEVYKNVTRIDLVARDTIDELILEALANKQQIAEHILGWKEKL
jgi:SNF2 family DNA or RNA helicase